MYQNFNSSSLKQRQTCLVNHPVESLVILFLSLFTPLKHSVLQNTLAELDMLSYKNGFKSAAHDI